ncbi:hypothetical protein FKM82_030783 [Ascaphus truei]
MEAGNYYDIPDSGSPASINAEEDMITLESVSENFTPTCVAPEVMSSSQPTKEATEHADGRIENLLKALKKREEQMMQLHKERHDEVIGVHGKLLSQLITITDIMQDTNHQLVTHNAFMGGIAQSLQNISDTQNWHTSASSNTPPQKGQRHFPKPSQSQLVAQEQDIAHITPHPVHRTVPIEDKQFEGVHTYAHNATQRTTKQNVHLSQTARESPEEVLFDDFQDKGVVETFDSVQFLPSQLKGTPGHSRSRGLGRRFTKSRYSRGRGRNLATATYSSGAVHMSPCFATTETKIPGTMTSSVNSQVIADTGEEKHGKKKKKNLLNDNQSLERPQTRSQPH